MRGDPAGNSARRSALLTLIRRLRGGRTPRSAPPLELVVEAPPEPVGGSPPWRFWLWLIDELRPTRGSGAVWRVRLDPPER